MSPNPFLVAIFCVLLSSAAQLLMKRGMLSAQQADLATTYWTAFTSPFVWCGVFLFGLSAIVWLWVLARVDVGLAYPLVGLGLVVTYFAGVIFFEEPFSWLRIFACALIVLGITLLAAQYRS